MTGFVHLSVHTEYSIRDSVIRPEGLVDTCVENAMPAVAVTDRANLFGAIRFVSHALSQGVKPILGSEVLVRHPDMGVGTMTLLCRNLDGYKHLCRLLSQGYDEGAERFGAEPVVTWSALSACARGLTALSGGRQGLFGVPLENDRAGSDRVRMLARDLHALFEGHFYLELHRTGDRRDEHHLHQAVELAAQEQIPVVATNPVRFVRPDQARVHDVRSAIARGVTLSALDNSEDARVSPHCYLKTAEEMRALFSDIPAAVDNTLAIARHCNVEMELGKNYLPAFAVPAGYNESSFLKKEAYEGLERRLHELYGHDEAALQAHREDYEQRLAYELEVIDQTGFPGYFLIVSDFIRWSKTENIPVGPGRGSGAGSLVAYALEITSLDPLRYNLLFERFLNPERVSMPDFDIDFCMDRREEVIEYVASKYGSNAVSQIITFGTMAAKMVVRDVARALGYPYGVGDRLSKMIPNKPGTTLVDTLNTSIEFESVYENDHEAREIIDYSLHLEGLTRQVGTHAGGVLIAPSDLTDFTPTYREVGHSELLSQYDKDDVEKAGLVKFDFLGLRTLTIIQNAVDTINAERRRDGQAPISIDEIPLDDASTFELLNSCATTAVFQLESQGMKQLIHQLQPDSMEEIIALVALYRPGPLQAGMVDDFVNRKHGRARVEYPHPWLEPVLENTYGVFVYQEQVMQAAQTLAGYSLGQADMLRRAMGKKKPKEMEEQREIFCDGAVENGIDREKADNIFELIATFAGYGFNKSHSAAYGLIAFQTAWLKAHYPAQFMAAVLSSDMDNTDKVVGFIAECKNIGIEVEPPNVNESTKSFAVGSKGNNIVYGLGAIKGMGGKIVEKILPEREQNGRFKNFHDFVARVNPSKPVIEAAIKSGALDCFGHNRATLFDNIELAKKAAKQINRHEMLGVEDMFGAVQTNPDVVSLEPAQDWDIRYRLQCERETLGLYITGHPVERFETEIGDIVTGGLNELCENRIEQDDEQVKSDDQVVVVAGVVVDVAVRESRKGNIAFLNFDDSSRQIKVNVFSRVFNESMHYLLPDEVLVIEGKLHTDRRTSQQVITAFSVEPLELAREKRLGQILAQTNSVDWREHQAQQVRELMEAADSGGAALTIDFEDTGKQLPAGEYRFRPTEAVISGLQDIFGASALAMHYRHAGGPSEQSGPKALNPLDTSRKQAREQHGEVNLEHLKKQWIEACDQARTVMGVG